MAQLLQYYKALQSLKTTQNQGPTFEDLTIDDNIPEIDRVMRYSKSSIALQRLVHVKQIGEVAVAVGYAATRDSVIPVLDDISADMELAIRCHLCEQIVPIAKLCRNSGEEEGYNLILDELLPILSKLLEDDKAEVRHVSSIALVEVSRLIKVEDLGQYILTIILRLAHEDDNEDMRMTAAELLNELAEDLGLDLCKQFVIPEVVSLAEDPVFRVRKSAALNIQNICKVGGEHELFERLMPAFVRLSKDDMYRVRRACAESLPSISKHVGDDIRVGVLVEIFLRLAQDSSKFVKQRVLQQSGMFISTLPKHSINDVILGHYKSMVRGPLGDAAMDEELLHACAFSFPGVLLAVGAEKWTELRDVYHALVQCQNITVKQTLALSLHEIARILGSKLVEEELVAVFEELIQGVEVVRMGIIKHLAEFLFLLSEPCRVSYLPLVNDILQSTSPFNWRLREALAVQLPALVALPPPSNVFNTLFPLAMTLLQDPVAEVRRKSFSGVSRMIQVLIGCTGEEESKEGGDGSQYMNAVARAINALSYGETFQHRQLWAELALQFVQDLPEPVFIRYFLDGIVRLSKDSVVNVRVAVARILSGWDDEHIPSGLNNSSNSTSPWNWLLSHADIKSCIEVLSHDDCDVVNQLRPLAPLFPDTSFIAKPRREIQHATASSATGPPKVYEKVVVPEVITNEVNNNASQNVDNYEATNEVSQNMDHSQEETETKHEG